jgi:hypothetical protein
MARYTITLPAGQASITIAPVLTGTQTYFDGQVIECDPAGPVYAALTAGNLRALSATAGTGGAGNKDTMGEAWCASNASS